MYTQPEPAMVTATTRRGLLRAGLGMGGAALALAAFGRGPARIARAAQSEDEQGEDVALPPGAQQVTMPFEFTVRQGPNSGLTRQGVLSLVLDSAGTISRGLFTTEEQSEPATVAGQITGRAVNLVFSLSDGRTVFGVGTSRGDLRMGAFDLGGPLVGPEPGDSGDWLALGASDQDSNGVVYLVDAIQHVVYRITDISQPAVVYAGIRNTAGLVNGPRLSSRFSAPNGIGIRRSDNAVFIADTNNRVVRMISRSTNTVSSMLTAAQAQSSISGLSFVVQGIAATANRLYISDRNSHCILRYNSTTNQTQLLAGAVNTPGFRDSTTGAGARFRNPAGLSLSPDGSILNVVDSGNGVIRQVFLSDGAVTTLGSITPG